MPYASASCLGLAACRKWLLPNTSGVCASICNSRAPGWMQGLCQRCRDECCGRGHGLHISQLASAFKQTLLQTGQEDAANRRTICDDGDSSRIGTVAGGHERKSCYHNSPSILGARTQSLAASLWPPARRKPDQLSEGRVSTAKGRVCHGTA